MEKPKAKVMNQFIAFLQEKNDYSLVETYRDEEQWIIKVKAPKSPFSWFWFLVFFGIFYLIHHWSKKWWDATFFFDEKWMPIKAKSKHRRHFERAFWREIKEFKKSFNK